MHPKNVERLAGYIGNDLNIDAQAIEDPMDQPGIQPCELQTNNTYTVSQSVSQILMSPAKAAGRRWIYVTS